MTCKPSFIFFMEIAQSKRFAFINNDEDSTKGILDY